MDNLSVYESEQIHAISAWKSELPSSLGSLVSGLFGPLKPWVAPAVPRSLIERAVAELATLGATDEGMAEVAGRARISDVRELRFSPMKECDSLASRVTMTAQRDQLVQNLLRQAGGRAGLPSFPLPLLAALRFICRVGHCYGYALDRAADRRFVLSILDSSTTQERQVSIQLPAGNRSAGFGVDAGRVALANGVKVVPEPNLSARRAQRDSRDRLILDHMFLKRVDVVARRAFQERWLVENGKADTIAPSSPRRRSALDDMNRVMSQMAYLVGGAIGFGAVFPVVVLCELLVRGEHAGARGVRDGARSAVDDADAFLAGLLGREPPQTEIRRSRTFGSLLP
jgi:hypothetical protein